MTTCAILYPGHSAEDDYPLAERLLRESGVDVSLPVVGVHSGPTDHTVEALLHLGRPELLSAGAQKAAAHAPDAVMWACTSGSFVFGTDGVREQAAGLAAAAGVRASSTSLAFLGALRALGVSRVAVSATYPEVVARRFRDLLADAGVEVVDMSAHDVPSGEDAGRLAPEAVMELAGSARTDGAEALLVPDTALHTIALLPRLEQEIGLPVLTANQVTVFDALAMLGVQIPVAPTLGTLFSGGR
ncbi:maleate cis-trans isomerase [Dietzia maris]|uniref:maleate cis-trans isomerase family protein n=1 Tax=Dietzia maris TaxID=37915 RepID=UPI00344F1F8A